MTPSAVPVLPVLDGVVVTAAGIEAFDCPVCGDVRDLVVPVCDDDPAGPDDTTAECPDRACAVCGLALVVGSVWRDAAAGRPVSARPPTRETG